MLVRQSCPPPCPPSMSTSPRLAYVTDQQLIKICATFHGILTAGKVAGAKWEGSKTVFDDAGANDGQHSNHTDQPTSLQQEVPPTAAPSRSNVLLPDVKWKKLAVGELKKVHTLPFCSGSCCFCGGLSKLGILPNLDCMSCCTQVKKVF